MVWHVLKEARTQKSTLPTIWLDIANAYGSILYKLIIFAVRTYGISLQWIRLVENYCKGIFSKWFCVSRISSWYRHQQGIFACCTLSLIFFLAGMKIILEYSLQVKIPNFTTNDTELALLHAFTDDLSLMCSTVSGIQTLLSHCTTALTWSGLEFRDDKSCSIVTIKGRSMNSTPVYVSKATDQLEPSSSIPSIHSGPAEVLGSIIDGSLSDRSPSVELAVKLLSGSRIIDKSHFTATQKLWIFQHLLILRIQQPLLTYELPISLAFKLE